MANVFDVLDACIAAIQPPTEGLPDENLEEQFGIRKFTPDVIMRHPLSDGL